METTQRALRRGLPRVAGGQPWPIVDAPAPAAAAPTTAGAPAGPLPTGTAVTLGATASAGAALPTGATTSATAPTAPVSRETLRAAGNGASAGTGPVLRSGLPRTPGGEPWPAPGTRGPEAPSPVGDLAAEAAANARPAHGADIETVASPHPVAAATSTGSHTPPASGTSAPALAPTPSGTPTPSGADEPVKASTPGPRRYGRFTLAGWIGAGALGLAALMLVAAVLVLAARGLTTFQVVRDFLERYPGEYHLPDSAPVGFPAWLGWQHFLNVFLMVLIVRSGWQVRRQQKPPAYFAGRKSGKKISINLWFHQCVDVLWMANGLLFVVLLFASGQWMRVIPTSWEVFPNALSALLQYASLDWPVENGWVNYNSLQQLTYGLTIFVAAPVAALSGWRMSSLWPARAQRLSAAYRLEWARAVHFPVMLYFVGFVLIHVLLVFTTGALRNLNHMYAATDGTGWTGFWMFAASLVVIAGAVVAARPVLLAPLACRFGSVSSR